MSCPGESLYIPVHEFKLSLCMYLYTVTFLLKKYFIIDCTELQGKSLYFVLDNSSHSKLKRILLNL